MRKPIGTLIVGTLCLLAGCSSSNQSPSNSGQPGTLTVTTTSLPAGTVGVSYSTLIIVSGGTAPYSYSGGNLPAGLSMNNSSGMISGIPSQAAVGTTSATVKVTDSSTPSAQTATSTLSIKINPASLVITTQSLPAGVVGSTYPSTSLQASGGVGNYSWVLASGSNLPAGLTLSSAGDISGTPSAAGSTSFGVTVTDSSTPTPLSQTATLSVTVTAPTTPPSNPPPASQCGNMSTGNGASLNGFVPFPASNLWNTNIASAAVDPNSSAIISALAGSHLHPDFSNVVDGNYGIPYVVVDSSVTPPVPITMNTYASESDVTLYPIPATAPIEGFPPTCSITGDNHLIVIDKNKCWIYETWQTEMCSGAWTAANGAIWDMTSNEQRPYGWTSADAAGLPIFPGLVRYDEVAAGAINHAFRMTLQHTKSDANGGYFVAPATHAAGIIQVRKILWECVCG